MAAGFEDKVAYTQNLSMLEPGDLLLSVLREQSLYALDRLVLMNDPVIASEWFKREEEGPIRLRNPVVAKRLFLSENPLDEAQVTSCPDPTDVGIIHARISDAEGNVIGDTDSDGLVEGTDSIVDPDTGFIDVPSLEIGGTISIRYHTYQVFGVARTLKQARVSPMRNGVLYPEEGDGPARFVLRPTDLGMDAKHNPSATYLPPAFK
jgi:hypothetical protein